MTNAPQTLYFVTYSQMVRNLFKKMGNREASTLHAIMSLSSEIAELLVTDSIEEIVEELGDMEFYLEASYQSLERRPHHLAIEESDAARNQVLSTITTALSLSAGRALELIKTEWVRGVSLDSVAEDKILLELLRVDYMIAQLSEMIGVKREDILQANQAKWGRHSPDLVYAGRQSAKPNLQ